MLVACIKRDFLERKNSLAAMSIAIVMIRYISTTPFLSGMHWRVAIISNIYDYKIYKRHRRTE